MSQYTRYPPAASGTWKAPVSTAANLPATGNNPGDVRVTLDTDAIYIWNGTAWILEVAPGATPPGGSNTQVQYNNSGAFAGSPGLTYVSGTQALTVGGAISAANLSGTNTGDVTLAAVGAAPNANGASLTGQVLNLQPADGSSPGALTAGAQTVGGVKTFSSAPVLSSLSASLPLQLDGSKNVISQAINLSSAQASSLPVYNVIYVDKLGSDTTGDGSLNKPVLTITKALTLVSAPASTNRYKIHVGVGSFSEATLALPKWTWIEGDVQSNTLSFTADQNPTTIEVLSGSITLDASWADATDGAAGGLIGFFMPPGSGISFDRQIISGTGSATFQLDRLGIVGDVILKSTASGFADSDIFYVTRSDFQGECTASCGSFYMYFSNANDVTANVSGDTAGRGIGAVLVHSNVAGQLSAASTMSAGSSLSLYSVTAAVQSITGPLSSVYTLNAVYAPVNPADWATQPVNINEALDKLAASPAPISIGFIDTEGGGPNANGLALQGKVLYAQSADATHPGMVNTGTQTLAGNKTFTGDVASQTLSPANGATGTFTTADLKTVTVTKGIITSIV